MLARAKLAQDAGKWVLASEVDRAVRSLVRQEIAQTVAMLREGARAAADRTGADYREVKAALFDVWRAHRARSANDLAARAPAAMPTAAELAEELSVAGEGRA